MLKKENKLTSNMLSIILPCHNEEQALEELLQTLTSLYPDAEIIVSDSSTDKSPQIAKQFTSKNVILHKHDKLGYGNAYLEGFKVATGETIIMMDADGTYLPADIKLLLQKSEHADMVIGNRFPKMEKGAMPKLHKYLGNPTLSFLLRLFFHTDIKDCHCGMRLIKKKALNKLTLRTTGMEFASEMIVKAVKNKLKIKQVDIHYKKRQGVSKLNTWKDGWKHLRFLLLYSPTYLFFYPGLVLFGGGLLLLLLTYFTQIQILNKTIFYHPMFGFSLLTIIGYQLIFFSIFSKIYAHVHLKDPNQILAKLFKFFTLEKSVISGLSICLFGILFFVIILTKWINSGFGELEEIKNGIMGLTFLALGIQTIFSGFILSIIGIEEV